MIELTLDLTKNPFEPTRKEKVMVNPDNINTVFSYEEGAKVLMDDGKNIYVQEDFLDVMQMIVNYKCGIRGEG